MWPCQNLATRPFPSPKDRPSMKQRPGVAVRAGLPVCQSLSPCQVHAGPEVATGWVCPQIRSSSPRPGCWGREGIFLIL